MRRAVLSTATLGALLLWAAGQGSEQPARQARASPDWTQLLPPGEGKEHAAALCNSCHTVAMLMIQHRSREGWESFLKGMNAAREVGGEICACLGGPVYEDEIKVLAEYLGRAFGPKSPIRQLPLNVNSASMEALLRLPGLELADANKIVEYRQRKAFASKNELERLIGRQKYLRIENFVDVRDSNFRSGDFLSM